MQITALNPEHIEQDFAAVNETVSYYNGFTFLSNTIVANAEYAMQNGYFNYAADICNIILKDDRVFGAFENRVSELPGSSVRFEGRSKRAKTNLFEKEDFWDILPEDTFKQVYVWTLLMGFSICQLVWKETPDGRELPTLNFIHPRNIRWDRLTERFYLRCGLFGEEEIEVETGTGKFAIFRFSNKSPWQDGLWVRLARLTLLKSEALASWLYHIAHYGNSINVLKQTGGGLEKAKKDIDVLLNNLTSADKRVAISLPTGYDISQIEPNSKSSWEQFKAALEYADTGITILIVGSNLSTSSETGFANLGTTQRQTNITRIESDAETFSTLLHDQVLVPYTIVNLNNPDAAPYPVWDVGSDLRSTRNAAMLQMTGQAILPLLNAGVLTKEEARAMLHLENIIDA